MKRALFAMFCVFAVSTPVQAHFVWILPGEGTKIKVVFSDQLGPDQPELLDKIKQIKLFAHDAKGDHHDLKLTKAANCFESTLPAGVSCIHGSCVYGVFQRGEGKPMLLKYYATCETGGKQGGEVCWECMPMQAKQTKPGVFTIQYAAAPLANVEVVVSGPVGFQQRILKTDTEGVVNIDVHTAPKGVYGLRFRHDEAKPGEYLGKKYETERSYLTYVFTNGTSATPVNNRMNHVTVQATPKEDAENPKATILLADARAVRAQWSNFPGFAADLEVNIDDKVLKGASPWMARASCSR